MEQQILKFQIPEAETEILEITQEGLEEALSCLHFQIPPMSEEVQALTVSDWVALNQVLMQLMKERRASRLQ